MESKKQQKTLSIFESVFKKSKVMLRKEILVFLHIEEFVKISMLSSLMNKIIDSNKESTTKTYHFNQILMSQDESFLLPAEDKINILLLNDLGRLRTFMLHPQLKHIFDSVPHDVGEKT